MAKFSIEGKMEFDHSVITEDRFALRTWFQNLVKEINYNDRGAYSPKVSETFSMEGSTEQPIDHDNYLQLLSNRMQRKTIYAARFPELHIQLRQNIFQLTGRYEEFIDGILSYEGTVRLGVAKTETSFALIKFIFYPRLRLVGEYAKV